MNMLIHIVGLLFIAFCFGDGGAGTTGTPPTGPQTTITNSTTPPMSSNSTATIDFTNVTTLPPNTSSEGVNTKTTSETPTSSNSSSVPSSTMAPSSQPKTTSTPPSTTSSVDSSEPTKVTPSAVSGSNISIVTSSTTTVTQPVTSSTTTVPQPVISSTTTVTQPVTSSVTTVTQPVTSSVTPSSSPPHNITITETNILLVNPQQLDTVFVELSGAAGESLDGLFLTIRNASEKDYKVGIINFLSLTGNLNVEGFFVVDKSHLDLKMPTHELDSVVVALYSEESQAKKLTKESLLDSLLFSVDSNKIASEVAEVYHPEVGNKILVEKSLLNLSQAASISFCSGKTYGFVLTTATKNETNNCDLKEVQSYQMKLTHPFGKNKCNPHLPKQFSDVIAKEIVAKVNEKRHCGLTMFNVNDLKGQPECTNDDEVIAVKFNVRTVFDKQIECITVGYNSFTNDTSHVTVHGKRYLVANCSQQCFSNVLPHSKHDGNNMKVTVAVVISCIGVFLVILLVVIIYMKRKRRGILQFRMTRLDEDEDDLVGDMDDFVGNQGATFSNFRS